MKTFFRFLLVVFFCGMGIVHFAATDLFVATMPPYLPYPRELVWISGVFEILGGVGVLIPSVRRLAGYGLVALLVVVFPVNLHMALHPEVIQGFSISPLVLWLRLPFQAVFIAWVLWCTREDVKPVLHMELRSGAWA